MPNDVSKRAARIRTNVGRVQRRPQSELSLKLRQIPYVDGAKLEGWESYLNIDSLMRSECQTKRKSCYSSSCHSTVFQFQKRETDVSERALGKRNMSAMY